MKRYKCNTEVFATPMNRQDYNYYRNWTKPEEECGDDEGYLVECASSNPPNHPDHNGYISWCPKQLFEEVYSEI